MVRSFRILWPGKYKWNEPQTVSNAFYVNLKQNIGKQLLKWRHGELFNLMPISDYRSANNCHEALSTCKFIRINYGTTVRVSHSTQCLYSTAAVVSIVVDSFYVPRLRVCKLELEIWTIERQQGYPYNSLYRVSYYRNATNCNGTFLCLKERKFWKNY